MFITGRTSEKCIEGSSRWLQHQRCNVKQNKRWKRKPEENFLTKGEIEWGKIEGTKWSE